MVSIDWHTARTHRLANAVAGKRGLGEVVVVRAPLDSNQERGTAEETNGNAWTTRANVERLRLECPPEIEDALSIAPASNSGAPRCCVYRFSVRLGVVLRVLLEVWCCLSCS